MSVKTYQRLSSKYTEDSNSNRTYSEVYECIHDIADTVLSIRNSTGTSGVKNIPAMGTKHPDDSGCFVSNVDIGEAQRGSEGCKWDTASCLRRVINVVYTNINGSGWATAKNRKELGAYNVSLDIVAYPATLRKAFPVNATTGLPNYGTTYDTVGKRKTAMTWTPVNGAGEFIQIETTKRNNLLRFNFDNDEYQGVWQSKYVGSINLTAITIAGFDIPVKSAKLLKLNPTIMFTSAGAQYYSYDVEIECELEQSVEYREYINAGYKFRDGGLVYDIYTDGAGAFGKETATLKSKITEPYPLTAAGALLVGWNGTDASIQPNNIKVYDTWPMEWSVLGFPDKAKERRNNR